MGDPKSFDPERYKELYGTFDPAHQWDHAEAVAREADILAKAHAKRQRDLVRIAAYTHDIGISRGRDEHEQHGGDMVKEDKYLKSLLTPKQLEMVEDAVRNHRASSGSPASTLAKIVADADRLSEPSGNSMVQRAYVYKGRAHLPEDERLRDAAHHVVTKYVRGGNFGYDKPVVETVNFPETRARIQEITRPVVEAHDSGDINMLRELLKPVDGATAKSAMLKSAGAGAQAALSLKPAKILDHIKLPTASHVGAERSTGMYGVRRRRKKQ